MDETPNKEILNEEMSIEETLNQKTLVDEVPSEETLDEPGPPEMALSQVEPAEIPIRSQAPATEALARQSSSSGSVIVALGFGIMLVMGILIGFFGRPLLIPDKVERVEVVVTAAASANQSVAQADQETDEQSPVNETSSDSAESKPSIMDFILADARHFAGDPDAPITMVEFSDFKCPYCNRFAMETLGQLRAQYIETGKVRFVYRNFPILGPESSHAAEAAECAGEQDKFWEFHDLIFQDQLQTHRTLDDAALMNIADELGLDIDAFSECYTSGKYATKLSQETLSIQSLGVRGTPGFLVNGVYVVGAQPFESFAQLLDQQLAAIERGEDPGDVVPAVPQSDPSNPRTPEGPPPPPQTGS